MIPHPLIIIRMSLLFIAGLACIMAPCVAQQTSSGASSAFSSSDGTDGNQGACQARPTLTCFITATQSADAQGQTSTVAGKVDFTPFYNAATGSCRTRITGTISGLGTTTHGWHVHQKGDISNSTGMGAGDHYNPFSALHGIPDIDQRTHEGDLGNLQPDATGAVTLNLESRINTRLILGRGLIVHALRDQGASAQPAGSSGARLGQCVLGRTDFASIL